MRYYYFNPFSKQYLFPKNFKQIKTFKSFYVPFTLKGKVMWFLWYYSDFFRSLFEVQSIIDITPISNIEKYISKTALLAFNRGTSGIEQKITILGYDTLTGKEFFIKYAENTLSKKNVNNEGEILAQLKKLDFVPIIESHIKKPEFVIIQTSVLEGKPIGKQNINEELMSILTCMSELNINTTNNFSTSLNNGFAHGDFCPWNMMLKNNKLKVFDWEMAGTYPIGYDLFTYIFQTSFLLSYQRSITTILEMNSDLISSFFYKQGIENWQEYLIAFADIKIALETPKENVYLCTQYQKLKRYAESL